MKKIHVLLSNALIVALLLSSVAFAQDNKKYEFAKDRSISQTYSASGSDKLSINNQFGNVTIRTWSRNEVKVDIKIEVSSTNKEDAEEMFDRIDVTHSKNGGNISFKTTMENSREKQRNKDNDGKSRSNSIHIDYEVSMPAGLDLDLENRFGKTTLPDLQGKVDVDQQFGNLEAGRLSNANKITVKFGGAQIESVDGGTYDFQFASDGAVVRNATGDIKVNVQHCKGTGVVIYGNNVSSMKVNAQHSDVALVVPRDMSATYSVETQFGSFKNSSGFSIREEGDDNDSHGPKFNHTYKGSSNGGKTKVVLDGNFTDFTIGHEAPPVKAKGEKEKKVRSV
jgi:hypothetical protein